jgi:hypothetical protein
VLALGGLFLISAAVFISKCGSHKLQRKQLSETAQLRKKLTSGIKDYARPEEDTYFTYPEWYIVWSYQEKADYQEKHLPSEFPYFAAIGQYWSGYCHVFEITHGRYPTNWGDHLMLAVLGASFTVEYGLKGAYEKTIGKVSEWLSRKRMVEEDEYAYHVAKEYAEFVHIRPFYEFHFFKSLKGLWNETPLWGPHVIRKWERKAFLSLDYAIEGVYAWLLAKASHTTYGIESANTYAWIKDAPHTLFQRYPRVREVKDIGEQNYIVIIPRYQEFTDIVDSLAHNGIGFVEIAGNDEILVTALAPRSWTYDLRDGELLFSDEVVTQPELKRIAVRSRVESLHTLLRSFRPQNIQLEHVYDY